MVRGKPFNQLRVTEVRVLQALAGGDSVLLTPHPTERDRFRCVFSSAPEDWGVVSHRVVLKLQRRGLVEAISECEFVITERGRAAVASVEVDPIEALAELELLDGLAKPRREVFLRIMSEAFTRLQRSGVELTEELIRSVAVEAAEHVRSGGSVEAYTGHVRRGTATAVVEPEEVVVLRSNSTGFGANQFRRGSSVRRNYGRATHRR